MEVWLIRKLWQTSYVSYTFHSCWWYRYDLSQHLVTLLFLCCSVFTICKEVFVRIGQAVHPATNPPVQHHVLQQAQATAPVTAPLPNQGKREREIHQKYRTFNTKKSTFKDTMKTRAFLRLVLYSIERVRWIIGKCKQNKALNNRKENYHPYSLFQDMRTDIFLVCRSAICNKKGYCIFFWIGKLYAKNQGLILKGEFTFFFCSRNGCPPIRGV